MANLGSEFTPDWQDKRDTPLMASRGYQLGAAAVQGPAQAAGTLAADAAATLLGKEPFIPGKLVVFKPKDR